MTELSAPDRDLILCLLRPDWEQFTDRIATLAPRADWPAVASAASRLRALVLVAERLTLAGLATVGCVCDELIRPAERLRLVTNERAQTAEMLLLQFLARCAAEGFRAVHIKGPGLGRRIFGDAGVRPFGDVDVLVAPERLDTAANVAAALGFVRHEEPVDKRGRPLLHVTLSSPDGLPSLEIHWRVNWYEAEAGSKMLERAHGRPDDLILAPADELVMLALCFARDGLQGSRYAVDIATWTGVYGRAVPSGAVAAVLAAHPALRAPVIAALARVDVLLGTTTLERFGDAAMVQDKRRPRIGTALRVARAYPSTSAAEVLAREALTDVMLAPRQVLPNVLYRRLSPRAAIEQRRPTLAEAIAGIPTTGTRIAGQFKLLGPAGRPSP